MQVSGEPPPNGFVCENRFDYSFASSLLVLLHVSLRTARGENSRHKLCARLQILPLSAQSRLVFVQKGWFILHLKGWIIVINIYIYFLKGQSFRRAAFPVPGCLSVSIPGVEAGS